MAKAKKVHCTNPEPGKSGADIGVWKFEPVREIILAALSERASGVRFDDPPAMVRTRLSEWERRSLGSVSWHTTVVKLHIEAVSETLGSKDLPKLGEPLSR